MREHVINGQVFRLDEVTAVEKRGITLRVQFNHRSWRIMRFASQVELNQAAQGLVTAWDAYREAL